MEYRYIGDLVNTHGIKGEVRILSDFSRKDLVFLPGTKLYIGRNKEEQEISHYRVHKNFDMVTFKEIDDINEVIGYKGDKVYVDKNAINMPGFFNEDLIGLDVYCEDELIGKVNYILKSKAHDILVIETSNENEMVPNIKEFVEEVDLDKHRIMIKKVKGLLHEN